MSKTRVVLESSIGRFELENGEHIVGRGQDAALTVPDPSISRAHAILTVRGDRVLVQDLRSSNGTYLNGQRLEAETVVAVGDRLTFGQTEMRLLFEPGDEGEATRPSYAEPEFDPRNLFCTACGAELVEGDARCRVCGFEVTTPPPKAPKPSRPYPDRPRPTFDRPGLGGSSSGREAAPAEPAEPVESAGSADLSAPTFEQAPVPMTASEAISVNDALPVGDRLGSLQDLEGFGARTTPRLRLPPDLPGWSDVEKAEVESVSPQVSPIGPKPPPSDLEDFGTNSEFTRPHVEISEDEADEALEKALTGTGLEFDQETLETQAPVPWSDPLSVDPVTPVAEAADASPPSPIDPTPIAPTPTASSAPPMLPIEIAPLLGTSVGASPVEPVSKLAEGQVLDHRTRAVSMPSLPERLKAEVVDAPPVAAAGTVPRTEAPKKKVIEVEARRLPRSPAPMGLRFVAFLIDGLLFNLIAVLSFLVLGWLGIPAWSSNLLALLPATLVFMVLLLGWGLWGTSPGKRLLDLWVVPESDDGGSVGLGRALLRLVGFVIGGLILGAGFIMAFFRTDRRALHDLMAGTRVVRGRN